MDLPKDLNDGFRDYVHRNALRVQATEAAGFVIKHKRLGFTLEPCVHIRRDDSDDIIRAAALNAFDEIARPCVEQQMDGAIEVGDFDGSTSQYCLVIVLAADHVVNGVAAWIVRTTDAAAARAKLRKIQDAGDY